MQYPGLIITITIPLKVKYNRPFPKCNNCKSKGNQKTDNISNCEAAQPRAITSKVKIQPRPIWDRGTAVKEATQKMATVAGQAVHIAAEATGGTGSLIKNTVPFQQLWPGPKWNRTQERGSKESRRPAYTKTSYIFLPYLRANVFAELSKLRPDPQRISHINCFQFSQMQQKACRLIQILLTIAGL